MSQDNRYMTAINESITLHTLKVQTFASTNFYISGNLYIALYNFTLYLYFIILMPNSRKFKNYTETMQFNILYFR